jgi:hypothetical protein
MGRAASRRLANVRDCRPDLARAFGAGVRLERALLEVTNDPVTTEIKDKMPSNRSFYDPRKLNATAFHQGL